MSNITTKDQKRIQNYIDQNLIRFDGVITDPNQIRRTAKKLGLSRLVDEAYQEIHYWSDKEPDKAHLATAREIQGGTGFLVGVTFADGLFCDFGLLFEIDNTIPYDDAQCAMIALSEDCARWIFEHKYQGEPVCECCEGKGGAQ
jgi:hypothetical protein